MYPKNADMREAIDKKEYIEFVEEAAAEDWLKDLHKKNLETEKMNLQSASLADIKGLQQEKIA
jgi:hypothetical protein